MLPEVSRFMDLFFYSIVQGSILSLLALGLSILMGTTRLINIAHGDFMVLGIYIAYVLYTLATPPIPPPLSALINAAVFGALALALYITVIKPILAREEHNYIIATLIAFFGISLIIQNSIAQIIGSDVRGLSYLDQQVSIYGFTLTLNRLVVFAAALAATAASYLFFSHSRMGTVMLSVVQDMELSRMLGIDIGRVFLMGMVISLTLAGFSGALYSTIVGFEPYMGVRLTILAFFIAILGGIGNIAGTIASSYLISAINMLANYYIGPWISELLLFALVIAILIFRPQGLFGVRAREV